MASMVTRSKVADSRRPYAAGSTDGAGRRGGSGSYSGSYSGSSCTGSSVDVSVHVDVVGVEVVQPAGRAVAPERSRVLVEARGGQQSGELGQVLLAQRLLHAVRAERLHRAL